MMKYAMAVESRKGLVKRVGELAGVRPKYMGVPSCAYQIGTYTVEKDGTLSVEEEDTDMAVINTLISEGMIEGTSADIMQGSTEMEDHEEQEDQPEQGDSPTLLNVSFPMSQHTGVSLCNLLNLIYSRGHLISKATGADFHVDFGLIETLKDDFCGGAMEDMVRAIADYEDKHGNSISGLTMTSEELTFTGFHPVDADHADTYTKLASKMNAQALTQKRIQAKTVDETNEKYAMRTWLVRIGMGGDEFKTARKILMQNLSGHTAFRTPADAEKFSARQKAKRDALKTAKEAAASDTADGISTTCS